MIDLFEGVRDYLKDLGFGDVGVSRLDEAKGREGVVVLPMPRSVAQVYMDMSEEWVQPYQVVVRRRSEAQAMVECSDIADALEHVTIRSRNGSFRPADSQGQQIYTAPQELQLDEEGFYAWHVRMSARIEID